MAISKLLASTGSDNWELISSVTPTAATSAVNFTGLSPYKKLMVVWQGITLAATTTVQVRLNNDSTANYYRYYNTNSGGIASNPFTTNWEFGDGVAFTNNGWMIITNCDTSNIKILEDGTAVGSNSYGYYRGIYRATAIVSQVNFITSSTFTAVGTVALYGVK